LFGNFFDVHHYIFQKVVYYLFIYSFFLGGRILHHQKWPRLQKYKLEFFFISLQNHM